MPDDERRRRLAVELRNDGIVTRRQFNAGNIAHPRNLALRALLDDDVAELLLIEQPPLRADGELKIVSARHWRLGDCAGGDLKILLTNGAHDITGNHVARGKPFRVKPEAHREIARPEHRHFSNARKAGELVLHLQEGVVADVKFVARVVG